VSTQFVGPKILKVNVGFIMNETSGFSRELEFNVPSHMKIAEDLMVNHLYANLQLSHTGEGVLVRGKIETSISDACSRCMDDVWIPVEFTVEELFAKVPKAGFQYFIDDAGNIDLAPLFREEALLQVPMVTPYDKQERCVFCHRTWHEVLRDSNQEEDDIDPRFAALLKLKDQLKNDQE
jgi:uncharacterized protein